VFDAVVVVLALGLNVSIATGSSMLRPYGGVTFAVLACAALALLFRRQHPVAVAWISVAVAAALPAVELVAPGSLLHTTGVATPVLWWPPSAPFAAYAALAFSPRRRLAWTAVIMLAVATVALTPLLTRPGVMGGAGSIDPPFGIVYRGCLALFTGALLGLYFGARGRLMQSLIERAERAEREQHLLAERTRMEERERLAAEMHDVVVHRVSLMVVQAGALGVTTRDEATRVAADELRASGCLALAELRDAVGLLHRGANGLAAHRTGAAAVPLPDLSALISESESVGVRVEVVDEGDPALASPVVGRTAYRVVQEALTNVRKHAPGAEVQVHLRYRPDGIRLTVRNTAPTGEVDTMLTEAGSGVGLWGLRQRVELVNGTLHAGPADDGGFCVEARLPTSVPTTTPTAGPA
jgi:signal transduction histidine kinase